MFIATGKGTFVFTSSLQSISLTRSLDGSLPVLRSSLFLVADVDGVDPNKGFSPERSAEINDLFRFV